MPTVTWDAAFLISPADTDDYKYGANKIRQLKVAIDERMSLEHDFANTGKHLPGKVSCLFSGNTAEVAALANMYEGAIAKDTTTSILKRYTGAAWEDVIPLANETLIGIVQFANSNECIAGIEANKVVTPVGLRASLDSFLSFAILQNRQTANTNGGTATSGSWLIVPINTKYEDADGIIDVSNLTANTYSFGLAAGTYKISAKLPFGPGIQKGQGRLFNITSNVVQQNIGSNDIYSSAAGQVLNDSVNLFLNGTFVLANTSELRLEYKVNQTVANTGHGIALNYGPEVYAEVEIIKMG